MRAFVLLLLCLGLAACQSYPTPNPVDTQVGVDETDTGLEGSDLEEPAVPGQ